MGEFERTPRKQDRPEEIEGREKSQVDCIIECPSCEGEGELPDGELYPNHCPACSHPIRQGQKWCGFHREAENFIPDTLRGQNDT